MSKNREIKKDKNQELEELNKNEEDFLAFSSKYKTNIDKEEENIDNDNESRIIRNRLSLDSTTISQEHSNISGCNFQKLNTLPNEDRIHRSIEFNENIKNFIEFQGNQRKMSSPLCNYFFGSDIYLSKTQKNTIDMDNSYNFIKKDNFFNIHEKINNDFINNVPINNINDDKNNLNINLLCQNQNTNFYPMNNKNTEENQNNKKKKKNNDANKFSLNINQLPYNNINNNQIPNINNNFYFQNNNYQPQIFNINYINLNKFQNCINPMNSNLIKRKMSHNIEDGIIKNYFNNALNINNIQNQNENIYNIPKPQQILFSYNEEQEILKKYDINKKINKSSKNVKKPFDKRKGDWICPKCHNLNFAFRIVCNRCKLPKPINFSSNEE